MTATIITVTPTIMDGTVARWYRNESQLAWGRETISASRNGVMSSGGGYITPDDFEAAWAAHLAIKNGHDVNHLATHRRRGLTGPYEPIDQLDPMSAEHGMSQARR